MRTIAAPMILSLSLALTSVAAAQAPSEAAVAEARQRFEEAEAAYSERRFQTAADLYLRSYQLLAGHPNQYLVLFNRGQALAQAGQYDEAIASYRRYLTEGGDRVENRGEVDQRIADMERLRGGSGGGGGPDEGLLVGSIVTLSVGALALAGMGIFGGLALAEHDSLAAGCGATRSCSESDVSTSDTFALVADVNLGIGGAALTAGVVLLILALTSGGDDDEAAFVPGASPNALSGAGVIRW